MNTEFLYQDSLGTPNVAIRRNARSTCGFMAQQAGAWPLWGLSDGAAGMN